LVVLALLALACKDQERIQRDEALKQNLAQMRRAIAAYHTEQGRYPSSLNDLVPKYLPAIPAGEWRVTTEETVQPNADFQTTTSAPPVSVVIDVHSGEAGTDRNGVPYANY
jgi:general secretion pathway protein G